MKRILAITLLFGLSTAAHAQDAWVSDQFEIMLRTGPSTGNAIVRQLPSGTSLRVLERDQDAGYSRVQTAAGTEGWVLTRYLMSEPSAREQLERLTRQLSSVSAEGSSLTDQLNAVKGEYATATNTIASLERDNAALENELADIKRTAANVLNIDKQNQELMQSLDDARIEIATLEQTNRELSGESNRTWFMVGAAVLILGIILGLWLPRIRWQKRSRYDRF